MREEARLTSFVKVPIILTGISTSNTTGISTALIIVNINKTYFISELTST